MANRYTEQLTPLDCLGRRRALFQGIALFPILADVVEVKKGSRSTAHWSNDFIRLNRWLSNSFAQLITPLDIDSIGQNWEDSNKLTCVSRLLIRSGRGERNVLRTP